MPFLSMVRSACAETFSLIQRFSLATQKRRSCRLGRKRRRVLLLACETLLPVCTPLPVTWHTRDITHLDRSVGGPRSSGTLGPAGQRTVSGAQRAGNYAPNQWLGASDRPSRGASRGGGCPGTGCRRRGRPRTGSGRCPPSPACART